MTRKKPSVMKGITSDWMTVSEAASVIGCCSMTVLRLVNRGVIRGFRVHPRMYLVNARDVGREQRESARLSPLGRPRGS